MSRRRLFGQAKVVHWRPKQNEFFPDTTGPGSLLNADFPEKDSKRFADSGVGLRRVRLRQRVRYV
jgi:hypothetical protein